MSGPRRQCPVAQPMDDSLLGHWNLSLSSKDSAFGPEVTKSTHGMGFFFKVGGMASILSVLLHGKKEKKNPTCVCSSEWACCPSPIPHHAAQTSAQGQVHAFQREKINLDPAVVQLKDISHSYIFNKVDLFLLLPRKLVLRCTQIITYCGTVNYYKCTELKQPQVWARFSNVLQMFMVCCKTFVKLPTQHSIYWRILARGNSFSLHRCCIPEIFCLLIEDWWNSTLKNYNERNQILSSGRGGKKALLPKSVHLPFLSFLYLTEVEKTSITGKKIHSKYIADAWYFCKTHKLRRAQGD